MASEFHRHRVATEFDAAPAQVLVWGSRIQMQQVLVNLLRNACESLKNTPSGERRVSVRLRDQGTAAELIVADNGPGLPADAGNRIFEPFFTTKPGGMGMGLAVSRSIVEAHGGRLWADPCGGTGAEFHLSLPTATGADADVDSADGVRH
jgi:two-component system sensor kinase FixL